MRRSPLVCLFVLVALLATACGSSDNDGSSLDAAGTSTPPPATSPPVLGPNPAGAKPVVTVPDEAPPATLQIEDITVGTGAEATAGKMLTVHYVGVAWSTNEEFDSSWDRGDPITLTLGAGQVIPGWDQGLVGMKVGGRRELIVPPDLAYGAAGYQGAIAPNETLIFVVDLIAVQ